MLALAWVMSLAIALVIGYFYRDIRESMATLKKALDSKIDKRRPHEPEKSLLVDALDPVQQAKMEYGKTIKDLNPDYTDEYTP